MTFERLEKEIGYTFRDKALLKTAFVHSTYANAHGGEDNERLEFLGDSVLQLVVSEMLYFREKKGKALSEGEMTALRQALVRKEALLEAAEKLSLKNFLLVEGGEANVGGKTVSSLFETLSAAVYLDGGYESAKRFILEHLAVSRGENYKGELQEFLQKKGLPTPSYSLQKEGKDNDPMFVCLAEAEGKSASGRGKSKTAAEQEAAKNLLAVLSENENPV